MGTRADFYVGYGLKAEWLGSIAWDGYRSGIHESVLEAQNTREFRSAVKKFFKDDRDDVTLPERGWPWPWNDSRTSDCSYWFFDGRVWDVHNKYGTGEDDDVAFYLPCNVPEPVDSEGEWKPRKLKGLKSKRPVVFPDMSGKKNVRLDEGSGLILLSVPR